MERLSYFVQNEQITAERFYEPMLRHVLQAFAGEAVLLTLDTSMLWDQFCLIEVCFVWGGRSFTLAQVVLEHGSATVGFEQYQSVLRYQMSTTFLRNDNYLTGLVELQKFCSGS